MELPLQKLSPVWMKDRATGKVIGFFFLCPVCSPAILGLCPHPILIYSDPVFAEAHGRECWTLRGNTFQNVSVLGNLNTPACRFRGWISQGRVRW